jgi:ribosomal protein S27E
MREHAQVYCDECENWITVEHPDDTVKCDCGRGFLVTITPLPTQSV